MGKEPRKAPADRQRQEFKAILGSAASRDEKIMLEAAEQAAIGYYYDMLAAMAESRITGRKLAAPDITAMKKAVTEINRACANQNRGYLFDGEINDHKALFQFAAGIIPQAA